MKNEIVSIRGAREDQLVHIETELGAVNIVQKRDPRTGRLLVTVRAVPEPKTVKTVSLDSTTPSFTIAQTAPTVRKPPA